MTEQSTAFGGTTVAAPPAPLLPVGSDDTPDDDNRRKLAVVGAVVGVAVLLIVAFFMLKGGGSSDSTAGLPAPHPAGAQPSAGGHGAQKPVTLPKPYKGAVGRDPFKALVTAPVAAAPSSAPGVPSVGGQPTTVGTGTTGQPVGVPVTTPGSTGTGTGTGVPANFSPVWIELVHVNGTSTASFVVGYSDGKKQKTVEFKGVRAPQHSLRTTFGRVFALLSLQDGTATVQLGDGTPFDLAPGFGNRHFIG
jgi:hypothetical protein